MASIWLSTGCCSRARVHAADHVLALTLRPSGPNISMLMPWYVQMRSRVCVTLRVLFCKVAMDGRVMCSQCGIESFPHSSCKCRLCGRRHQHGSNCRSDVCHQCGLLSPLHRACTCRHCGEWHSKLGGCRELTPVAFRRLPSDLQHQRLSNRVDCEQCGSHSYPHEHCRCRSCGCIHSKRSGCRRSGLDNASAPDRGELSQLLRVQVTAEPAAASVAVARSMCVQCGVMSFPHQLCRCSLCGLIHSISRGCRSSDSRLRAAVSGATPAVHDAGAMDIACPACGARSWPSESVNCCARGEIQLPGFPEVPLDLAAVILAPHVRQHIRAYNMAMAMASVGHDNVSLPDGTFVLGGKTFHRVGSMRPHGINRPAFAQIYVLDVDEASERRLDIFGGSGAALRRANLQALHAHLCQHNACVRQFVSAAHSDVPQLVWRCNDDISTMQVGAMIVEPGSQRDIIIRRQQDGHLQFISDGHALYHPLAYPLLFPLGTAGWHEDLRSYNLDFSSERVITLSEWGRYFLMHRDVVTFMQRCERLSLEFYCDVWAQVESRNAHFHRLPQQQAKYRSARVAAFEDQLSAGAAAGEIGQPVIRLPSSFVGSNRWYQQLYMDAMALPKKFGKPDFFITMTCNPHWPEIRNAVPAHSHWKHHPDIVSRVFMLKLKALLQDIVKAEIFGPVRAYVYRIEWQARG